MLVAYEVLKNLGGESDKPDGTWFFVLSINRQN